MVAAVQHLLGLGMAVALYVLLLRRGSPRWLAALATAPVLLDAYQLQLEQTVMPDVLFEALLVAGLAVLLWRPRPRLWMVPVAGVLLGSTATMWQPGEILIVPAVIYVLIIAPGWRQTLRNAGLVCPAFAVPIVLVSLPRLHQARPVLAGALRLEHDLRADGVRRGLPDAQAAVLRAVAVPAASARGQARPGRPRPCPGLAAQALRAAAGMAQRTAATDFTRRVMQQQPLRVAGSILRDAEKLFEVHRVSSPGDTRIGRWQFQTHFPRRTPPTSR